VELLRPGGLVLVDNVFYAGSVVDGEVDESHRRSLAAIREVNDRIASDERVDAVMLGIADGVTIALKR
jgi:predicted O-methyltransferase YrrM